MKEEKRKILYIAFFITILFAFVAVFFESKIEEIESIPVTTIQTTPLRLNVGTPLLNQGGERGGNSVAQETPEPTKETPPSKNTEKITLILGTETLDLSFAPDTLFYDALVEWKNAGALDFAGKNYIGLGFFVTDIGPLHSGSGNDLLYYVNGKEATVGVSGYMLKNGDVIEWKLE